MPRARKNDDDRLREPLVADALGRVSANVQRLRQDRGWTQQQLAEAAALDLGSVQLVELMRTNVTIVTLSALAGALDVSIDKLLAPGSPPPKRARGRPRMAK